ncbi:hypothetical protein F4808DRAFT_132669 [Astrocystis sublimbata]|nr:hypothetical protein F4808DRAFT_132669 [Astrocystis sublimbata]
MMSSGFGAGLPYMAPPTFTNHQILDDSFRQQQAFLDSSCRANRQVNGPRPSGATRVVKPRSANNSPQSLMARRRTMANDNHQARRRQHALDQALHQHVQDTSLYTTHQDEVPRNTRPMSWHPSSHPPDIQQMYMQMPRADFREFPTTMPTPYHSKEYFTGYQNLPPTPAAYSGHTSPAGGFSPLQLSYGPTSQSAAVPAYVSESWIPTTQPASSGYSQGGRHEAVEPFPAYNNQASYRWHSYSPQEPDSCTAPPTPNECLGSQQVHAVPSEDVIPFQPLEESDNEEDEGEILVGMGLYDLPSKTNTDPELGHYRMTTSQLLGTTYRSGKGWKLEEAWEPPATDDEEDAEGEESGDEPESHEPPPVQQTWI